METIAFSQARANLAALVSAAEGGVPQRIVRRNHEPVVVLAERQYRVLLAGGSSPVLASEVRAILGTALRILDSADVTEGEDSGAH